MHTTSAIGKSGEQAARQYLLARGFVIRHTNWHSGHRELDIVAEKDGALHIVEVKTRSPHPLAPPLESVTLRKQRNIIAAADAYIQRFGIALNVQFDVITAVMDGCTAQITYIPAAYYPYL